MKPHGANALRLARWLSTQGVRLGLLKPGQGGGVVCPGLPSTVIVSFRVADPALRPSQDSTAPLSSPTTPKRDLTAKRFLSSTRLFTVAKSLGGIESLAELPSLLTTHGSLPPEAREALGISDGLLEARSGMRILGNGLSFGALRLRPPPARRDPYSPLAQPHSDSGFLAHSPKLDALRARFTLRFHLSHPSHLLSSHCF